MTQPPTAPAPQRVCPRCSTVAHTAAARCPHCRASYRRGRSILAAAAVAGLAAAAVLAGVYGMLVSFGEELDAELDRQVQVVQGDIDRDMRRLERRIERQLDRRLPPPGPAP